MFNITYVQNNLQRQKARSLDVTKYTKTEQPKQYEKYKALGCILILLGNKVLQNPNNTPKPR